MEGFLRQWGYLGVFLGIVGTGVGVPVPEELPIVFGGVLSGSGSARWWIMLPVCIVGVIIGDSFLYGIGRLWGPRLLTYRWVHTKILPPDRLKKIEQNFQNYGVRILLFARLTPGIRAPIFFTAGLTKLSLARFILADSIYAVPGVTLLFFLGYWFAEATINLIEQVEHVKQIIIVVVIGAIALYILYRFLRRPAVTGAPEEMPKMVGTIEQSVEKVAHKIEDVASKIIHPGKPDHPPGKEPAAPSSADGELPHATAPPAQPEQSPERGGAAPRS
ncbi:MAG: DedA family protein [Gemmataceae bacterium]|nr:DedA family protein [Gemmataceae bacterium]